MAELHTLLVRAHIFVGAIALILFWVPILTRKGSKRHRQVGNWYVIAMTIVSVSAVASSILALVDPIAVGLGDREVDPEAAANYAERYRVFSMFLLMLGALVFVSLRHGIYALRAKTSPLALQRTSHRVAIVALGVLAVGVGVLGVAKAQLLLIIFAVVATAGSIGMWLDTKRDMQVHKNRVIAHLDSLTGTGIGAYVAFFAFGGSRLFGEILHGQWQVVPWVLPVVIGTFYISLQKRMYRRAPERKKQPHDAKAGSGKIA